MLEHFSKVLFKVGGPGPPFFCMLWYMATIEKIKKVLTTLKIPKWFPDHDIELFYLAFAIPDHYSRDTDINRILKKKYPQYSDISYDVLEFYGDIILYAIIVDIFRRVNGLRRNLYTMDNLKKSKTSNTFLRSLSHKKEICDTVFGITAKNILPSHNVCGDTIESIIGALYYQYGPAGMPKIIDWFQSVFPEVTDDIWKEMGRMIMIPVHVVVDDEYDIAERFNELNSRCKLTKVGDVWNLYIDGYLYDSNRKLDQLVPLIIKDKKKGAGRLQTPFKKWHKLDVSTSYICKKEPFEYTCDSKGLNRVSKRNPRVRSCLSEPASGKCDILTDRLPLEQMADNIKARLRYAIHPGSNEKFKVIVATSRDTDSTIIEKYQRMEPSLKIRQSNDVYILEVNDLPYDMGSRLDQIIPVVRYGDNIPDPEYWSEVGDEESRYDA